MLNSASVEAWLDDNPGFTYSYFKRKATNDMVNSWLANRVDRVTSYDSADIITQSRNRKSQYAMRRKSVINPDILNTSDMREELELGGNSPDMTPIVVKDNFGVPSFYKNRVGSTRASSPAPRKQSQNEKIARLRTRRISQYQVKQPTPEQLFNNNDDDDTDGGHVIDERDMIMDLVMDITTELDLHTVHHRILQNVSILLDADRCSLFLVKDDGEEKFLVSRLFDINKESSLEDNVVENQNEIRIPMGKGAAGLVASTGRTLNIKDAYKDSRFNRSVDIKTGYHTKTLLCMPIYDSDRKIVGVAQVINKFEGHFTEKDEKVFASYLGFCGIAIHNAQLFEKIQVENKRNEVLLELARLLFTEQSSLAVVIDKILLNITSILSCERASVQLCDSNNPDVALKQTYEHLASDEVFTDGTAPDVQALLNPTIISYVQSSGTPVNISDVAKEKRFPLEELRIRALLCVPIKDGDNKVIGVIQLINKQKNKGDKFTNGDEHLLEAFAIFCGLCISHAKMYETQAKLAARQQVVLEVLSYHAIAPQEEFNHLMVEDVPSSQKYNLFSFQFNDLLLDNDDTLKASTRMFIDLDLFNKFQINYKVFCRWLASVKRNYRPVKYHNWRHAFNVCQSAFCMITEGGLGEYFDDIERLALLVSCLCHDLDHRGRNNAFQAKIEHPLARLYSTSTLENHHYNQCLMILQSEGCEIFSQLNQTEYSHVINLIKHSIISTDLAIYFQRKSSFFQATQRNHQNWKEQDNRALLRGMVMTSTDIAAITKPWPVQRKIAQELAEEFFEQGDFERNRLNQQPIDLMNRGLKHKLPQMQIGFIDSICLPLYESLIRVSPELKPLYEGCLENRKKWHEEGEADQAVTVF